MKRSTAILAVLLFVSEGVAAQEARSPAPARDEREVRAVQAQLITAYIKRDIGTLERILAP